MAQKEELKRYAILFKEKYGRLPKVTWVEKDMKIENAPDTGGDKPYRAGIISSWLEYWQAFAKYNNDNNIPEPADTPTKCSTAIKHNESKKLDGAHVQINNRKDPYEDFYIVPLCRSCNLPNDPNDPNDKKSLNLKEGVALVEAIDENDFKLEEDVRRSYEILENADKISKKNWYDK